MTRIDVIDDQHAGPIVRLLYRVSRRKIGRDVEPIRAYALAPSLLIGYGAFEQATGAQHAVPEHFKALAQLKAAALVNCEFCVDIGSALAREAGVSEAQMLAMPAYRDSDAFDEVERLVLEYAHAMSETPVSVGDELFSQLREHFNDRQLMELTNVIALENMRARFNHALDMTPAGFSDGMVCVPFERDGAAAAAA